MPYRQPAEAPKKEATPIERLVVSRYGVFPAIAIVLGSIALAGLIGTALRARVEIVCTRSVPGATPRCTALQAGIGARNLQPFQLRQSSLSVAEREWDDSTHTVISTPSGDLRAAVDRPFAEATVAGAARFLGEPNELRWEVARRNDGTMALVVLGAILFMIPILFIVKRTHLAIDHDARVIRVGKLGAHSFDDASAAKVEDIDDSAFYSLALVKRGDGRVILAQGRNDEVQAAAKAINRALAGKHESTRSMPDELRDAVDWDDKELDDDAKWKKMEDFLASLPIDDVKVVKRTKDRRIEARGTKRGLPIRVVYDPIHPTGTNVEVKAEGRLGFLDLEYDPEAKPEDEPPHDPTWDDEAERKVFFAEGVFVEDAKAAKAFRSLPADLQHRIATGMQKNDIRLFRIRPRDTTLDSRDGPRERKDPQAHVSAMLELAAEAAEYATKATPLAAEEDEEDFEDDDEGET